MSEVKYFRLTYTRQNTETEQSKTN